MNNEEIIAGINRMAEALDEYDDENIVFYRQVGIEAVEIIKKDKDSIFVLIREDVIGEAREMGIPEEAITDDVLYQVKKGVEFGLECWTDVVKVAINEALNR